MSCIYLKIVLVNLLVTIMFIDFLESLIYLVFIIPFILFFLEKAAPRKLLLISLFCFYFIMLQFLLLLPIHVPELRLVEGNWNWSGKIFATLASIVFYYFTRQYFQNHQFVKLKQEKNKRKNVVIVFAIILLYALVEGILFYNKGLNWETLLFQATVPGIEEEIAFRAIMLGLLSTLLVNKKKIFRWYLKFPAIWIIGLLFGFVHALKLGTDWNLSFNAVYFVKTFLLGIAWSWMTLKTKSIFLSMVSHNLSNFIPNLIGMLK